MAQDSKNTSQRKIDHINICLNDDVAFKKKTNGFEKYEFLHNAVTELDYEKIDLTTDFFGKQINYPFLISCMTGGVDKATNINAQLAEVASELNIPIGVGSQRQALENELYLESYSVIKDVAKNVPVLGNIGAAQIAAKLKISDIAKLVEMVDASVLVVHLNPLQELIQKGGEPVFTKLLKNIEHLVKEISVPIIAKEVGSGISRASAKKLLEVGVKGIDVAGAGGTSWSGVEMIRNKELSDEFFWDWGLPTSYCIREVKKLKKHFNFSLIGSGGIANGIEAAKAIVLGADITTSARPILLELSKSNVEGVINLLLNWFESIKKIMFLTGSNTIDELKNCKLLKKEELY